MTHAEFESIAALDVLGAATAGEASALRVHLLACLPCRRARDEYADAATFIALGLQPVDPPRDLRARVSNALAGEKKKFDPWWLAVAAMIFFALWVWREMGIRAARENDTVQIAELERLRNENAQLANRVSRTFELIGQQASARVILEPERRRAVVVFQNLPLNAADKSYQLWIIHANQPKPVSAGVFDATKDGTAAISIENLPVETEIKGLAVTLEPRGGVAQPTNTDFVVAGDA